MSGTITDISPIGTLTDQVSGTVDCGGYSFGTSGQGTWKGNGAPDGQSASGTYTNAAFSDYGVWSGAFVPSPSIAVTPDTDLVEGEHVTVTGSHFSPLAQIKVIECPASAATDADCETFRAPASTSADSSGSFTVPVTVHSPLISDSGGADCHTTSCVLRAENVGLATENAASPLSFATSDSHCTRPHRCNATASADASATAPGLDVAVTGQPSAPTGNVLLDIAPGILTCPTVRPTLSPIADLTDTGFAPSARLTVTATLHLTTATSAEQVCFNSTVPFKSQSSPTVAKAGTALLLDCPKVANVAPCVRSRKQIGTDIVVKFVVPGGDPRFCIVLPSGRQVWASHYGNGAVGTPYAAQFRTSGGKAPVHWAITHGKLPDGCTLNANSGAITGTPTTKGTFSFELQATDSEKPPKTARISLSISIK